MWWKPLVKDEEVLCITAGVSGEALRETGVKEVVTKNIQGCHLTAVFNQTLQQMLIGVLFSRWIFWARSGASIKYGTITAFSQKQIHLSHQTTYLYNFFTQKNIFNFNKHADQWIYQLLCYNFCHKPVQSRDRRQSTSVHCRVKLLSVYGGSVPHCPLLAAKWWQSHQFTGVIIISRCYPYVSTYQHSLGQSYSLWCDFPTLPQRQTSSAMKSSVVLYL